MNDDYDWETINTMQPYEVICCGGVIVILLIISCVALL